MDSDRDRKRKKDNQRDENNDDEKRSERKQKRARSRSRSPAKRKDRDSRRSRKHSRSQSPEKIDKTAPKQNSPLEVKKEAPERKNKDTDMLNTRTGGAYIPPARLRMMQAQITDKSSVAYQRLAWEALKKSIHGHINKINVGNIGIIIKELLKENIVRGRGLLCRSVIQAQAASPTFTNVYAALVAAINSRFPNIGELLLKRLVIQFKRGFKRNDKPICISSASFIAHLVNQRVAHEILALELLTLLVESPTDDSVEVAIAFLKECGQKLTEVSSKGVNAIFEMLRNILHEGQLDKRVQYMIEVMFQVWKDGFKDHPALIEELELVPEEDQFTHLLMLDDATDPQDILNVFKHDDKYEENEEKYKNLCKEILGSDAESGEEEGSGSESGSEESGDEDDDEAKKEGVTIIDNTETNLVALRRTIYLTINSSLDFEECAHKLMKMQLKPGQELELCHMFLDCCAEQRTYEKFYGLLAQRFCNINRIYIEPFENIFKDSYATAHRLDTNRLRNVSKFFAHLLFTDSISWEVLECVKLNEEDTTSSSRIYIKILFQELAEYMGLKKLNDRLKDPTLQGAFSGVFPRDNPKNTRFSINFFTSIGLGGLTDELREHLKQIPKNVPNPSLEIKVGSSSDSSSDSSSSSSDSSSSDSDSDDDEEKKKKDKSKNPKTALPENTEKPKERWGHDGFYDTYGKDARRLEREPATDNDGFKRPRPRDRNERDSERDDRNKRDDNRNKNERNGNSEDRGQRDRYDSRSKASEESRNRDRDGERGRGEDRRDERDVRRGYRDNRRVQKDDGRDQKEDAKRRDHRDERGDRREDRREKDDKRDRQDERNDKTRLDDSRDGKVDDSKTNRLDTEKRIKKEPKSYGRDRHGQDDIRRKQNENRRGKKDDNESKSGRERRGDNSSEDHRRKDKESKQVDTEYRERSPQAEHAKRYYDQFSDKDSRKSSKDHDRTPEAQEHVATRYYDQYNYNQDPSDDEKDSDKERSKSKKKKSHKRSDKDDGDDDARHKKSKKDKKKRSENENDEWDIKNKDEIEKQTYKANQYDIKSKEKMEAWDIQRESSMVQEVDRYWGGSERSRKSPEKDSRPVKRRDR